MDRVNAAQDRRIATRLRRDPGVLRLARANLRRWSTVDGRRSGRYSRSGTPSFTG